MGWSDWRQRQIAGNSDTVAHYITQLLEGSTGPILAVTDYVNAVSDSVRASIPHERIYATMGTDGFGSSDTRAALRALFGVDAQSIAAMSRRGLRAQSVSGFKA